MRILQNLTKQELDYYASRPKELHGRIMKDSIYIPKGDKTAAAIYVAGRDGEKTRNETDTVEISEDGQKLNQAAAKNILFTVKKSGDGNKISVSFDNSAMLHRAVEQGYIEVDGKQITLDDDVKKKLLATDAQIAKAKESVILQNNLMRDAAAAKQSGDAMKETNDKMSRVMLTASRIMHGKKVSSADEKELMEFNKDLYTLAKNAASLAESRHKRSDDGEDEKISAENDEARARESAPKDYSVEEIPVPQTEVSIDITFDEPAT